MTASAVYFTFLLYRLTFLCLGDNAGSGNNPKCFSNGTINSRTVISCMKRGHLLSLVRPGTIYVREIAVHNLPIGEYIG